MKKKAEGTYFPDDPDLFEGAAPDQGFTDFITGRGSIEHGGIAFDQDHAANPLRWAAALIRAHVIDDEADQLKLAIAHDLEIAAQGYGEPRILPLKVPRQRKLGRGERQDQKDADFLRQMLVLSVYAEHGRRKRKGSILDLAIDNGFSEDQWRKWSSKTDKDLRRQSRETGMVVTYLSRSDPRPPSDWARQVAVISALTTANVKWAR